MIKNKINQERMKEGGFSLIELVVAIGILMILSTVTGAMAYNTFNKERTQSAVEVATEAAYAKALNYLNDFDDTNGLTAKEIADIDLEIGQGKVKISSTGISKDSLCVKGH